MIPFLSTMIKHKRTITHSDRDGCYQIVLKPHEGLVAVFGLTLFSDQSWDDGVSEDFKRSSEGMIQAQRRKARDPLVFGELKKIQDIAQKNRVSPERVLLVDCSESSLTPDEVGSLVRDAFDRGVAFDSVRGNVLWPKLNNRVGLVLTDVLIDEVWGKTKEEYCDGRV